MPTNNSITAALSRINNDPSKVLGLKIGSKAVELSQFIKASDAQSIPELSFAAPSPSKTYIVVSLDLDGPFPSFTVLSPILHWIQPGLKAVQDESGSSVLKAEAPFVANYIGPSPPPGSAPHRYTFFLYEQPEDFDVKKYAPAAGKPMGFYGRVRFDLDAWGMDVGLGDIVAGTYFSSN